MLAARVADMDANGTRGVGALQQMVTDLIARVADQTAQLARHEAKHETEAQRRSDNRKWMISAFLTVAGLLIAIITLLLAKGVQ
jgi:hypothetical protein